MFILKSSISVHFTPEGLINDLVHHVAENPSVPQSIFYIMLAQIFNNLDGWYQAPVQILQYNLTTLMEIVRISIVFPGPWMLPFQPTLLPLLPEAPMTSTEWANGWGHPFTIAGSLQFLVYCIQQIVTITHLKSIHFLATRQEKYDYSCLSS